MRTPFPPPPFLLVSSLPPYYSGDSSRRSHDHTREQAGADNPTSCSRTRASTTDILCSHSPPRARTSYTLRDAGNNKMHVQRLASLGSNTRQVRRCPRATLDTIKPESYLSSHPRTSTSCIAVSCMWPSTTRTFWLAYVSTYDVGLVLASSPTHAGSPILCVACMYTWPLPLHTRASSTSRACDSARLTHSARTSEQANLHL